MVQIYTVSFLASDFILLSTASCIFASKAVTVFQHLHFYLLCVYIWPIEENLKWCVAIILFQLKKEFKLFHTSSALNLENYGGQLSVSSRERYNFILSRSLMDCWARLRTVVLLISHTAL